MASLETGNKVWVRVYRSSGLSVGPTFDKLTEAKPRSTEPYGSPPDLKTGEIEVAVSPSWSFDGQLCIRQSAPLPSTILSVSMEVAVGG